MQPSRNSPRMAAERPRCGVAKALGASHCFLSDGICCSCGFARLGKAREMTGTILVLPATESGAASAQQL